MRRDADREERNARLLAGVVLAAMLVLLSGIIHLLYPRSTPRPTPPTTALRCRRRRGETALPKIVCLTFDDGPSKTPGQFWKFSIRSRSRPPSLSARRTPTKNICPFVADIAAAGASDRAAQRDASILQNLCEHRRILAGHQNAAPGVGAVCGCGGHRLAAFPRRQHKHSQPPLRRKRHHENPESPGRGQGLPLDRLERLRRGRHRQPPDAAQILRQHSPRC